MPRPQPLAGFSDLAERIEAAVKEAITLTVIDAEGFAQQEAPVRKIFEGQRRSLRPLTTREFKAEAAARRQLGMPTTYKGMTRGATAYRPAETKPFRGPLFTEKERVSSVPTNPYFRARQHRVTQPAMKYREVNVQARMLVNPHPVLGLTRRGKYELATGRADFKIGGKVFVGGRLKHSIYIGRMEKVGRKWVQHVNSPTYYSRYVEFGTRHAAAQPFMRPALAKVREKYRTEMVKSIRAGVRKRVMAATIPTGAAPAAAGAGELVSPVMGQVVTLNVGHGGGGE